MSGLRIGDPAPDFTLRDQFGQDVSLSSYRGTKAVAILFYPYAFSGVCTGEMAGIRDRLEDFMTFDTEVLAISCDPMFALRAFADQRVSFIEARFEATREAHPDLTPAQVLARVFTDEGYAAGVRELPVVNGQSAGEQLCQQHCPVSHVAHEFPQLGEAETQAISRVLGRHVQRLATIAHGDGVCTTCIPDLPTTSTTSSTEKERVTS